MPFKYILYAKSSHPQKNCATSTDQKGISASNVTTQEGKNQGSISQRTQIILQRNGGFSGLGDEAHLNCFSHPLTAKLIEAEVDNEEDFLPLEQHAGN